MLGLLAQPKPQRADVAINTLCDRLSHSLLLEDRKAAVLSLRGLAHDSREHVASAGLRGLLETLVKDSHDAEAARSTLETLLILFSPETRRRRVRRYVSPLVRADTETDEFTANDISLWLADELLHNDEALACVLSLAGTKNDPFTTVYALQLVSAMAANRLAETKQAMLATGGVSTIISALGSAQDMVRDEALLLLGALTTDHLDLQKLVVFEGGLDRVFGILNDAGGVVFGGRLAEDCLSVLANLLQYNTSNQVLFTQSGYVKQWVTLLEQIRDTGEEDILLSEQAITNIVATLQIGQLLTVKDAERTTENQNILSADGALRVVLEVAFGPGSAPAVRVAALVTIASLVDSNTSQQNQLLSIDVPYYDMSLRKVDMVEPIVVQVAQGLLNWAVSLSSTHLFDLRAASLLCLNASLRNNHHAKQAFLEDQIEAYRKRASASDNVNLIETLAEYSDDNRLNPFRIWFAAAVIMHIFVDSPESKELLQKVTIGDEALGMEVHGFMQAIAGEMQATLTSPDATAALGYLQLLTVWFYDCPEAVSEFTAETSAIQALLSHQHASPLVQSLAAIVLGTAYAFCTSTSRLPRKDFHQLLTKSLGRDHYLLLMRKFRKSSTFQNYDEADIFGAPRGPNGIPCVYLDSTFVDLMRDSLGRISRAIDADPNIEPSARVSFEMVEELNVKVYEKTQELSKTAHELSVLDAELTRLRQDFAETVKNYDLAQAGRTEAEQKLVEAEAQVDSLKELLTKSQNTSESSAQELGAAKAELAALDARHQKLSTEAQALRSSKDKFEDGINKMTRELIQLQKSKESLDKDYKKLQNENSKLAPKLESSQKAEKELKEKLRTLETQTSENAKSTKHLRDVNEKLVQKLKDTAELLKAHEASEKTLNAQLAAVKASAEDKEHEIKSMQNREIQARKEASDKVAKLQASEKRIKELEGELQSAQAETQKLKQRNDEGNSEKLRAVSEDLEALRAEKRKLEQLGESEKRRAKDEQAGAQKTISELSQKLKSLGEVDKKFDKLVADNKKLQAEQAAKQKAEEALKGELDAKQKALDELLVLLDDLTDKKSSYKERLRALKEDVSDSESESESEDEDEDEDDEDDDVNNHN